MTYLLLNLAFVLAAVLVLVVALATRASRRTLVARWWLPLTAAGGLVMGLTALFDNIMIQIGLMTYSSAAISGLAVGLAPLEDFAYPLAGLILLPALWLLLGGRGNRDG